MTPVGGCKMSDKIDKLYDLVEKMYVDLSQKISGVNQKIDGVDQKIDGVKTELKQDIFVIEQVHGEKLDALLDGYKQLAESQTEIKADLEEIKAKQEAQEVEIKIIKMGRIKEVK